MCTFSVTDMYFFARHRYYNYADHIYLWQLQIPFIIGKILIFIWTISDVCQNILVYNKIKKLLQFISQYYHLLSEYVCTKISSDSILLWYVVSMHCTDTLYHVSGERLKIWKLVADWPALNFIGLFVWLCKAFMKT